MRDGQRTLTDRLRFVAGAMARKLVGGLLSAACAQTWMPGTSPGTTTSRPLLGEHRARHD
jgi:hypothetical protein